MNKVKFFLFLAICLCVSSCSDEGMMLSEQMFFGDGEVAEVPAESAITGVPEELQLLLWGDRDDYMEQFLGLPEDTDEKVAVRDHRWASLEGHKTFMELEEAREWLLDQIRLIDAQREYYTKYIDAGGVAIIGHARVDDVHFYNAREVILTMTSKRPEIRERLTPHYKYAIAGSTENNIIKHPRRFRMVLFETDRSEPAMLPEYLPHGYSGNGSCGAFCKAAVFPSFTGTLVDYMIVVHEFAHAIHYAINDFQIPGNPVHSEINKLDPTFQGRLETAYAEAQANVIDDWEASLRSNRYWTGDYAMTNDEEYWAEGVEYWFEYVWFVYEVPGDDFDGEMFYHDSFLAKDPLLYALLAEWFPPVYLRDMESRLK